MIGNTLLIFYFLLILINCSLLFFFDKIASSLNIYDYPDKIRKFHKGKVAVVGGYIIIFNLLLIFILNDLLKLNLLNLFEDDSKSSIFLITSILIFILGAYDDRFFLSANKKFFFLILIIYFNIYFDEFLHLNEIRFSFTTHILILKSYSLPFTILCFLLFINAINMFDGINFQTGFYIILILLYFLFFKSLTFFSLALIFCIMLFLILNVQNKIFLGDSGAYLISYILGYCFIKLYNSKEILYSDQVFFIMLIPGLDMLRLFITRIYKKKNPFSSDRMHIHYLLTAKIGIKKYLFLISFFLIIKVILGTNFFYNYFLIIFLIIIYTLLIYFSKITQKI